ncbi:MAG TPA: cyclic nucleotide-binding domain-containing protein [Casimicrobiaceae bacterium]
MDPVAKDAEMLANVPLFSGMSAAERKLLVFTGQVHSFADGDLLMRQGDPADCAYVILDGQAEVLAETAGDSFVVATLGPHSMPGEIGVLINEPRTATVRAKGKVRALRISPDVFVRLATSRPDTALHVMRQLSRHIANDLHALASLREALQQARADAAAARAAAAH